MHRYTRRLFLVDLGQALKVIPVEGVGGQWVIPPLMPKNIYRDAKLLSLNFILESISYTLSVCFGFRKFCSECCVFYLCLVGLRVCEESILNRGGPTY